MQHLLTDPPAWVPASHRWLRRLGLRRSLALLVVSTVLAALGLSRLFDGPLAVVLFTAGLVALFGYLLLSLLRHLDRTQRHLHRQAQLDALTGAYNRRHFLELVEREWSRAKRYEMPCALLLLDVDHFRLV
ncbi:MAG TPA: GGDEF domain-containing protein, partial [Roseateles sp.]|nr:GGDEF domain-containing protein [Roseateles sp.]